MNLNQLEEKVLDWANERGLLHSGNSEKQTLKTMEEAGELCGAVIKNNRADIIDAIGDIAVTIIILANQYGYDLEYCLQTAYDVIKDRTGRTIKGSFIKSEDLIK